MAAAVRDAVLNRVVAGNHDDTGTVGKLLQFLDATISSRLAAGAAVAKSPATLDWSDVTNAPTIGTSTLTTSDIPTASSIAAAVWSFSTAAMDALGAATAGKWLRTVFSGISTNLFAGIWSYATRTLSGSSLGTSPSAGTSSEDIYVTAFKNGTERLTARVFLDGADITQAAVTSIAYSVYLLDANNPDSRTAVTGHSAVSLTKTDVVFDTIQTDSQSSNYNFRHTPPISTHEAFATAGRNYLVEYTITPVTGQKVIVRFRVSVI
jgi:hypothetical protein